MIHPFGICMLFGWLTLGGLGVLVAALRMRDGSAHVLGPIVGFLSVPFVGLPAGHALWVASFRPEDLFHLPTMLNVVQGFLAIGISASVVICAAGSTVLLPASRRWGAIDATAIGLIGGWWWHRLGCTLVHDHPGTPTSFFLGVKGICMQELGELRDSTVACHDLGLYEWLLASLCLGLAFWVWRRFEPAGLTLGIPAVLYPIFRVATLPLDDLPPAVRTVEGAMLVGCFALGVFLLRPSRFRPVSGG